MKLKWPEAPCEKEEKELGNLELLLLFFHGRTGAGEAWDRSDFTSSNTNTVFINIIVCATFNDFPKL